jgi:hypothetical protein
MATSKLDNLNIELPDLVDAVRKLVEDGTTFAAVQVAPNALIPPLALVGTDTVPVRNGRFTLGGTATAQVQISVFNDPADKDDDQILQVTPGRAWLKHKLDAQIKGTVSGTLGDKGTFGLAGELGASLMQYRAHQPTDPVGEAVIQDVAGFLLPLRLADVQSLKDGDVLACAVHGKLGLSAQITFSDALSAAMASLDERLGAIGVSVVTLQEGATVKVNLSIEDDYRLVFRSGSQEGTTRVEVRKAKGGTVGGSVDLSLVADLEGSPLLRPAVDAYLESRLGQAVSRVEPLLQKIDPETALESLTPDERALAEQIAARLGLTSLTQQWQDLKTRLHGLIDQLTQRLRDAVELKVRADATLAYTRVQNEEAILACELDGAALAKHHSDLLIGDFTDLLQNLATAEAGYRLIEYLKQTQVREDLSFGFSISIGSWAASGKDELVWERRGQADLAGHERLSLLGQKTYTGTWGGATTRYAFGLAAAMSHFSSSGAANASEFDYSLSFGWSWSEALTPSLLSDALDLANVWNISHQRENDDHQNTILSKARGLVRIELEIQISDAGVRSLLGVPDGQFERAWIEAMAAALPRARFGSRLYRTRFGDRVQVYGDAAEFAFAQSAQGGADIAAIAGRIHYQETDPTSLMQLQQIDQGTLTFGGFPDLSLPVLWTATTIGTRPAERCRRAKAALDQLADAISGNLKPSQIEQVFVQLQDLLSRPYEHRVMGRVVSGLVKDRRPGELITKLKVTAADGTVLLV